MDPVFNSNEIFHLRLRLLGQIDEWAGTYLSHLNLNSVARLDFWYFTSFCSTPVFEVINWEHLTSQDIARFQNLRELVERAYVAASATINNYATREGRSGRRSFRDIVVAGLAVNMLPRLQSILQRWGFALDDSYELIRRELTSGEEELLRLRVDIV
jgi:hypothetical protein